MGKSYSLELGLLPTTYEWCNNLDIASLSTGVSGLASTPILTVGSGGSLTAAHYAAALHQSYTGRLAKAVTPLELTTSDLDLRATGVLLLSAGGRNPDIIQTFKEIVAREPKNITVLCFDPHSPLARLAQSYRWVNLASFALPSGKDGFLATNTLLAGTILLSRAYGLSFSKPISLPSSLDVLLEQAFDVRWHESLRERCDHLWERKTLVVLYGPSSEFAAIDLESKFTEAALGMVQIADFRNFAHGRHYWLAKHTEATGVLAFVTNADRDVADRMLGLFPSNVPVARIDIRSEGGGASIAALVIALNAVGLAGAKQGADPGRPSVPPFGRRIYNMRAAGTMRAGTQPRHTAKTLAIARKSGIDQLELLGNSEMEYWSAAYQTFIDGIQAAIFRAIVFDYDGTLCDAKERFAGISDEIARQLSGLLDSGVIVGVATGRGDSVKADLRQRIPRHLWPKIMVGYYNGADIGLLDDDSHPDSAEPPRDALLPIAKLLQSDLWLQSLFTFRCRGSQISIYPKASRIGELTWNVVLHLTYKAWTEGITLVRSDHSIDILAPGVSKRRLVERVRGMIGIQMIDPVLCIGDRGCWPGNDVGLLSGPYSLSVDEVSPDPEACWNLAPSGYKGVQALLAYLDALQARDGLCRMDIGRMAGDRKARLKRVAQHGELII